MLYTIQSGASGSVDYEIAEMKWKRTLELMFLRGAGCTNLKGSLLSPISSDILHELHQQHGDQMSSERPRGSSAWHKFW